MYRNIPIQFSLSKLSLFACILAGSALLILLRVAHDASSPDLSGAVAVERVALGEQQFYKGATPYLSSKSFVSSRSSSSSFSAGIFLRSEASASSVSIATYSQSSIHFARPKESADVSLSSVSTTQTSITPLPLLDVPFYPTPLPGKEEVSSTPVTVQFTDISRVTPEGSAAYALAERGIISGYSDGTFRPDLPVNRAEIIKLILKARNNNAPIPDILYQGTFSDVPRNEWYVPYLTYGLQQGIISGYPDGTFKAGYLVNTAEFLKMITVAFGLREQMNYTYQDVAAQSWYARYAGIASAYNLFPERPVPFLQPERYLTRGEVAFALSRLLGLQ